jgi:hypothetical protein
MKHPDFYNMKFLSASRNDAFARGKNEESLPDAARRVTTPVMTSSNGCTLVDPKGSANLEPAGTIMADQQRAFRPEPHRAVMEYPFAPGVVYPGAAGPPLCGQMVTPTRARQLAMDRALAHHCFEVAAAGLDDVAHWNAMAQRRQLQHRLEAQRQREILLALRYGAI